MAQHAKQFPNLAIGVFGYVFVEHHVDFIALKLLKYNEMNDSPDQHLVQNKVII